MQKVYVIWNPSKGKYLCAYTVLDLQAPGVDDYTLEWVDLHELAWGKRDFYQFTYSPEPTIEFIEELEKCGWEEAKDCVVKEVLADISLVLPEEIDPE